MYRYDPEQTPAALRSALELIAEDFPIQPAGALRKANVALRLEGNGPRFDTSGKQAVVSGRTVPQVLRALAALRGFKHDGQLPAAYEETPRFDTLGLMWDQSRNAVAKVQTVKLMLRRLALMGLNLFMLYTEDTYEVPGEPYLGYLRGRFTQAELKELDDYAFALGIEMIPCIQTLAHLAQPLRWWKEYGPITGSGDVLRIGEPKTYETVEKWIRAASAPFRSRRIHIGMDEAHFAGRNKPPSGGTEFDLMLAHLREVVKITSKLELRPMMWSDMWFTIGGGYGPDAVIPPEVAKEIPADIQLVYWDYYKQDPAHYAKMIDLHRAMGKEPIFAPGCWTDYVWWCHHTHAKIDTEAGMMACKARGVREAFTTAWGDDGGSCNFLSGLSAIQVFAEQGYRDTVTDADLKRMFRGSCDLELDAWKTGSQVDITPNLAPTPREWFTHLGAPPPPDAAMGALLDERGNDVHGTNPGIYLLWQDPMLGILDKHLEALPIAEEYKLVAENIGRARQAGPQEKRWLEFVHELARLLEVKGDLGVRLRKAYVANDQAALKAIAGRVIPEAIKRAKRAHEAYRRQWFALNKPQGFEVQDARWSALLGRLKSAQLRVNDYLAGRVPSLPELAEERLVVSDFPAGRLGYGGPHYRRLISPSVIT